MTIIIATTMMIGIAWGKPIVPTIEGNTMSEITIDATDHGMTRLNIATGIPFAEFCAAFEQAAPAYRPAAFESCRTWADVVETMERVAPHGLLVYARLDATPLLALTGTRVRSVEYLLGNHVIAETMFRHDANALLYAPLRVLVFSDERADAVFAIDRPSTVFAGLGHDAISATGRLLDGKVAGLLGAIGVRIGGGDGDPR